MKKRTYKTEILVVATALFLAGCASHTSQPKVARADTSKAQAQAQLNRCLSQVALRPAISNCLWTEYSLDPLGNEGENKAEAHWISLLEPGGPDYYLMGATLRSSEDLITEALERGGDPNMEMSLNKAYGKVPGLENITPLAVALSDIQLDDASQLLAAGANPNWRDSSNPNNDVAFRVGIGGYVQRGQNIFYAWDSMNLLLQHDYHPSGETLFRWYREAFLNDRFNEPEIEETYLALRGQAKPEDIEVFEQLILENEQRSREIQAARARQNADATLAVERAQARTEALRAQALATEMQNTQHMRYVGARICQDIPAGMDNIVRIGYVEQLAERKAQIRVSDAYMRSSPSHSPGGFRPGIIWDNLNNWYLCE